MSVHFETPELDTILEALANHKRRGMIHMLSLQPATIKQLADQHDLSLPAMHKHMRQLEQAGLVLRKKSGRTNFVALNASKLELAQRWIMQYHTNWGNPQATLDNYISGMKG